MDIIPLRRARVTFSALTTMEAKPQYEEEKQHSDGYPIS
jgi:hypothetical protein